MTDRFTKKSALSCFEQLAALLDVKDIGPCLETDKDGRPKARVGCMYLGHSTYGGYVVETISNEKGAIGHPFGITRRSARDFCEAVHFTRDAFEYKRGRK